MGKFLLTEPGLFGPLTKEGIEQIHEAAVAVLRHTGVYIESEMTLRLLAEAGAKVDFSARVARFDEALLARAVRSAPETVQLYNGRGEPAVLVGGDEVHFDPGSSGVRFLEADGVTVRDSTAADMDKIARLTDALPDLTTQSTAVVAHDCDEQISDSYRLYLILRTSQKPIVTGAFTVHGLWDMKDLLAAAAGGERALVEKPRAIFDVCPSPPLKFAELASRNIVDAARLGLPIEFISMPMPGAGSPATIAGSIVQHTAETLAGLAIAQAAREGAPVIWGGAPVVFDMRYGTTPMSAVEATMIGMATAQMGKFYGLPTHTYAALSDAKVVDAQAGAETALSGALAAMARVNMISGAGMLDFVNTFSLEKLVIDHEIIGEILRYLRGVDVGEQTVATDIIDQVGPGGNFLVTAHTRRWFRREIHLPGTAWDWRDRGAWQAAGGMDAFQRARDAVAQILETHQGSPPDEPMLAAIDEAMREVAGRNGATRLPLGPRMSKASA